MIDRWECRTEPNADQGKLYWHILLGDCPQAKTLASAARQRLKRFTGLHFTPLQWLHITTLAIGLTEDFTPSEIEDIVTSARLQFAELSPVVVTLGKVLYHPEAIAIAVQPKGVLDLVQRSAWQATCRAVGAQRILDDQRWNPHFTVAYSTSTQPARPLINALGSNLPDNRITVATINLVIQEGAERQWKWRSVAEIPLGLG